MKELKENTHIVIKREDIYKYLSEPELISLEHILHSISIGRAREGKKQDNTYYICNTDEPYADKVLNVILNQGIENGWIPCSERLPEENTEIIVCVRELDGGCYVRTTWLQDGQWIIKKSALEPTVIAWMPMPEVYNTDELDAKPCASTECVYQRNEPCPAALGCAGYEEIVEKVKEEE